MVASCGTYASVAHVVFSFRSHHRAKRPNQTMCCGKRGGRGRRSDCSRRGRGPAAVVVAAYAVASPSLKIEQVKRRKKKRLGLSHSCRHHYVRS